MYQLGKGGLSGSLSRKRSNSMMRYQQEEKQQQCMGEVALLAIVDIMLLLLLLELELLLLQLVVMGRGQEGAPLSWSNDERETSRCDTRTRVNLRTYSYSCAHV